MAEGGIGGNALLAGDLDRAERAFAAALATALAGNDEFQSAFCLVGFGGSAWSKGDARRVTRLLVAGEAARERVGAAFRATTRAEVERWQGAVWAAQGEPAWAEAWAAGRTLALAEAAVEARATPVMAPRGWAGPQLPAGGRLTPREREVLTLVALGHSDKEIAAGLAISRPTASRHVAAILAKLGAPSRAAAATIAVRGGLA